MFIKIFFRLIIWLCAASTMVDIIIKISCSNVHLGIAICCVCLKTLIVLTHSTSQRQPVIIFSSRCMHIAQCTCNMCICAHILMQSTVSARDFITYCCAQRALASRNRVST